MPKTSEATTKKVRAPRKKSTPGSFASEGSTGSAGTMSMDSSKARHYKEVVRELANNPAVRYVAAGIATAFLTRIANNMSDRYPEISNFIKENLDNVEGKLGEFRSSMDDQRH